MALTFNNIRRIGKAQLKTCTFAKCDSHASDSDMREQHRNLHLSMLLANNPKSPVKIIFNTTEGYSAVYTEVWGATEQFILLKEGRDIPIEAIAAVSLQ